jgi:hypothetical protein
VVPEEKAHSDHHHEGLGQQTKPAQKSQHKKTKKRGSVVDLDPVFQVNPDSVPIRIQGFDDQKLRGKIQLKCLVLNLKF